jgi:hypothetical protein
MVDFEMKLYLKKYVFLYLLALSSGLTIQLYCIYYYCPLPVHFSALNSSIYKAFVAFALDRDG